MIYQIHFTVALEVIALCLSIGLVLWASAQNSRFKGLGILAGLFGFVMAIVLLGSTAYFMYFAPSPVPPAAESQKSKVQMQLPTSGPSKGGYIMPTKPANDGSIQINKGSGIELPAMTVPKKQDVGNP